MREILFRGKHIHAHPKNEHLDGRWIYGYLCDENYINSPELEGEFLVDPRTVCQYTGLNDNTRWEELSENDKEKFLSEWNYKEDRQNTKEDWNGRKIFEGDIVKHFNDTSIFSNFDVGIILWNKETCGFHRSSRENDGFFLITDSCEYKVIGNIFDNPELLEVKNEID